MKFQEIERKWLMDGFPPLQPSSEAEVEQGYLAFEPVTLRIRKIVRAGETRCVLTVKGAGTLQRTEVATEIAPERYDAMSGVLLAPSAHEQYGPFRLPVGARLEFSPVDDWAPGRCCYSEVEVEAHGS